MQELRWTESQHLRTSKRSFDVKNITLLARELILWPKKKTNLGEGDFKHRLVETHFQVHEQDALCRQRRLWAYDEDLVLNSRTEKKEALRKTEIHVDMQTVRGVARSTTEANANLWRSFLRSCLLVR